MKANTSGSINNKERKEKKTEDDDERRNDPGLPKQKRETNRASTKRKQSLDNHQLNEKKNEKVI